MHQNMNYKNNFIDLSGIDPNSPIHARNTICLESKLQCLLGTQNFEAWKLDAYKPNSTWKDKELVVREAIRHIRNS